VNAHVAADMYASGRLALGSAGAQIKALCGRRAKVVEDHSHNVGPASASGTSGSCVRTNGSIAEIRAVRAHEIPERPGIRVAPSQQVRVSGWDHLASLRLHHGRKKSGWEPVRHIDTGSDPAVMRAPYDTTELALMPVKCFPSPPAVIPGGARGFATHVAARLVPNNSAESAFRM
jgi:hypothetical protein